MVAADHLSLTMCKALDPNMLGVFSHLKLQGAQKM
jgi:hypothetical protein